MNMLYHAHSGLRYLVLLAAVVAIVGVAYTLATRRGVRAAHVLPTIFTGLLDLQILLGIGLVLGGVFPDIVIGHLIMMVLAAVAAHGSSIIANRADSERRALTIRLVGTVAALVLIAVGIMALGRSVLGTAPMVG
jgi:cytochrome bd-type quinol oxidase subunit 2